jgi:hypothetical protein
MLVVVAGLYSTSFQFPCAMYTVFMRKTCNMFNKVKEFKKLIRNRSCNLINRQGYLRYYVLSVDKHSQGDRTVRV